MRVTERAAQRERAPWSQLGLAAPVSQESGRFTPGAAVVLSNMESKKVSRVQPSYKRRQQAKEKREAGNAESLNELQKRAAENQARLRREGKVRVVQRGDEGDQPLALDSGDETELPLPCRAPAAAPREAKSKTRAAVKCSGELLTCPAFLYAVSKALSSEDLYAQLRVRDLERLVGVDVLDARNAHLVELMREKLQVCGEGAELRVGLVPPMGVRCKRTLKNLVDRLAAGEVSTEEGTRVAGFCLQDLDPDGRRGELRMHLDHLVCRGKLACFPGGAKAKEKAYVPSTAEAKSGAFLRDFWASVGRNASAEEVRAKFLQCGLQTMGDATEKEQKELRATLSRLAEERAGSSGGQKRRIPQAGRPARSSGRRRGRGRGGARVYVTNAHLNPQPDDPEFPPLAATGIAALLL
jgi:hypothetical protein